MISWATRRSGSFEFHVLILLVVSLISLTARGELSACQVTTTDNSDEKGRNWHQWRGPDATGVSKTADPPLNWNDQTNIKWKIPIAGEGSSTPIVWGDVIFILSAIETNDVPKVPAVVSPESIPKPPNKIVEFAVWCDERKKTVMYDGKRSSPMRPPTKAGMNQRPTRPLRRQPMASTSMLRSARTESFACRSKVI